MKNHEEEKINPEQYWPDAEKLLDEHFHAKKRKRVLIWFCALLLTAAGGLTILNTGNGNKVVTNTSVEGTSVIQNDNQQKEIKVTEEVNNVTTTSNTNSVASNVKEINLNKSGNDKSVVTSVNNKHIKRKKQIIPSVFINTPVTVSEDNNLNVNNNTASENEIETTFDVINATTVAANAEIINNQEVVKVPMNKLELIPLSLFPQVNISDDMNYKDSARMKTSSRWDILFYSGVALVGKGLYGLPDNSYTQRRNEEEKSIILPYTGVQLSKTLNNWDIKAGVELAVLGEEVNYTPRSKGNYFLDKEEWQQFQYTVTDTDSAYVFGVLFTTTHNILRTDSVLAVKTDTLFGMHEDLSILKANGVNRKYVAEIPIEATYMISRGKFGFGISAGVAPGIVVYSRGNYLLNDESGTASLSEIGTSQFTVNARAGIEFSYLLGTRWRIVLRPSGRMYLSNYTETSGASVKHRSVGVNAGIMYKFR
jgi:hypothetical protein